MKHKFRIIIKMIAFAAGFGLLWGVVKRLSWTEVFDLFQTAGPLLLLSVFVYPLACVFFALGLRELLDAGARRSAGFRDLYVVRMIGDAINNITPFVDIGGEPLKMALMAKLRLTSIPQAVISIWISRIAFVASEIVFVLMGWLVLSGSYPRFDLNWVIVSGLCISLVYLGLLISAQMRGAVNIIPLLAGHLKIALDDKVWHDTDWGLRRFYESHPKNFAKSLVWQLLGWMTSALEVYIAFRVMGLPVDLVQAFIFQSTLEVIKTASFFIPANLGAQEGGLAALAMHMGFTAADGFALSVIKRFRHLVWIAVGLLFWKWTRKAAA